MNDKFDQFTKSMARSVTRRAALRRFGVGVAGAALACFGLANNAQAGRNCTIKDCYPPCPQGTKCRGYVGWFCYCA